MASVLAPPSRSAIRTAALRRLYDLIELATAGNEIAITTAMIMTTIAISTSDFPSSPRVADAVLWLIFFIIYPLDNLSAVYCEGRFALMIGKVRAEAILRLCGGKT